VPRRDVDGIKGHRGGILPGCGHALVDILLNWIYLRFTELLMSGARGETKGVIVVCFSIRPPGTRSGPGGLLPGASHICKKTRETRKTRKTRKTRADKGDKEDKEDKGRQGRQGRLADF